MDGEDKFVPARILWMRRWSPRLLSFRLERAPGFRFVPGQFARLGLKTPDGVPVWRAYSMASASWDEYLEFYSIVVPGGANLAALSRTLASAWPISTGSTSSIGRSRGMSTTRRERTLE